MNLLHYRQIQKQEYEEAWWYFMSQTNYNRSMRTYVQCTYFVRKYRWKGRYWMAYWNLQAPWDAAQEYFILYFGGWILLRLNISPQTHLTRQLSYKPLKSFAWAFHLTAGLCFSSLFCRIGRGGNVLKCEMRDKFKLSFIFN